MEDLKQRYENFLAKWEKDGGTVHSFECPKCHSEIKTNAPMNDDHWTTMAVCPECSELYAKHVTRNKAWGIA